MRIATWNVNSVKQRVPRLLPWLDERKPDVVCLQETKLPDPAFVELLGDELSARGYAFAAHGEAGWNGVAILSRVGLDDVVHGIPGGPGFPHPEARAVSATCGGIRVVCVYVPNGREPDSDHYAYKLEWLGALREMVAAGPEATIVLGDMNIAPADADGFVRAYSTEARSTSVSRSAFSSRRARMAPSGIGCPVLCSHHWPRSTTLNNPDLEYVSWPSWMMRPARCLPSRICGMI